MVFILNRFHYNIIIDERMILVIWYLKEDICFVISLEYKLFEIGHLVLCTEHWKNIIKRKNNIRGKTAQ